MASERNTELRNMSLEDLNTELSQATVDLGKMKYDHAVKGLDNPLELRVARREVARLKTELRRRELADFTPEQKAERSKRLKRRRRERSKK